jgi:hypothetical protein
MILEELQQLSTTRRDLRKFGLTVGGVFALLGALFLFRHKPAWPYFVIPGAVLLLCGLVAPRLLKGIYIAWMALAFTLGLIASTLVLSICYFLIITPLAFIGRLFGKDFLSQKLDPQAKSYWLRRERSGPSQPADCERQF